MSISPSRARILVSGLVQGVGFRYFCHKHARLLGLSGFARNLVHGDVEVEAQGEREKIEHYIERLRGGPAGAVVSGVAVEWAAVVEGEEGFAEG